MVASQAAALFTLTGCGGEASKPLANGEVLRQGDLMQRFRNETGEVLPGSRGGVMCFCINGEEQERRYGRFWLNVLPRGGGITAPENQPPGDLKLENQLREMLEEGEPDGVRWSLEREGWVAIKQYAANMVVVWHGGRTKADPRWKRLDRVLMRITSAS